MQGLYNLEWRGRAVCANKTGSVLFTFARAGSKTKKSALYGAISDVFCPHFFTRHEDEIPRVEGVLHVTCATHTVGWEVGGSPPAGGTEQ